MSTQIVGSTGVSLVQPGVVTQVDLSTNVAGNGPAFSAYQNTGQTVTTDIWTKVNLQTKEFDTTNAFDNTTNYRFQPTIVGYYQINGAVAGGTTGAYFGVISIYKNGTTYKLGNYSNNSNGAGMTVTTLVYLNGSTDYIELFGYVSGTAPHINSGISNTYLNGYLARSV